MITHVTNQPAGRLLSMSRMRRAAIYALCSGGVLGLAAAFGPIWVVRAGIALVLITGVLAVRFAWRETREQRLEHGRQLLGDARAHNEQLTQERQRNVEVVDVLRQANEDSDEEVVKLQIRIGKLRTQLSSLRGDNAALQTDLKAREQQIKELTADLDDREAELRLLRGEAESAEVLSIPRRVEAKAKADWDELPSAEDLWTEGNYPTVVDLQKLAFPAGDGEEQLRKQA